MMAFSAECRRHIMVLYCCCSGSTNKLFCNCFLLWQEANSVLVLMNMLKKLECAGQKDWQSFKFIVVEMSSRENTTRH